MRELWNGESDDPESQVWREWLTAEEAELVGVMDEKESVAVQALEEHVAQNLCAGMEWDFMLEEKMLKVIEIATSVIASGDFLQEELKAAFAWKKRITEECSEVGL